VTPAWQTHPKVARLTPVTAAPATWRHVRPAASPAQTRQPRGAVATAACDAAGRKAHPAGADMSARTAAVAAAGCAGIAAEQVVDADLSGAAHSRRPAQPAASNSQQHACSPTAQHDTDAAHTNSLGVCQRGCALFAAVASLGG
jgi:hypothetical protein